jgi:hypothetical protein
VSHGVSEVALNLSASLQKDSVAFALFLVRFAELTLESRDTRGCEFSALI